MGTATGAAAEGSKTKSSTKSAAKASGAGTKAKKSTSARRKKTTKSSSATANQATYNAARSAHMELAGQRSAAAARLSDPLWYRVEDVLPAATEETAMALTAPKVLPEQVQIVEAALSKNSLSRADVTPQAFCVLLEQARRHALELIAHAQDYAVAAGRTEIAKADFELASSMRSDHPISSSTQVPKLDLLAQQINRIPLPPIPTQCYSGVLLPPKRHQLTARTFDVVSGAQVAQKMVQLPPPVATRRISSSSTKSPPKPSYGAARGRQIPIQLKEKEPEKKVETTSSSATGGTVAMEISSPVGPSLGQGATSTTAVATSTSSITEPKPTSSAPPL